MKRPPRSFVVEVRRQRRPPGEPAPSWIEEAQKSGANGVAREAEPPPRPAAETATPTAPARPTGRILPSLIEAVPAAAPKAAKPPAPAKPRAQRRRARAPAPQPVRVAEPPPVIAAPQPVAEPAAETVDQGRAARHRRILARYVFGDALKPGERWKRRVRGDAP
jgi:hypothetical protein